jgi:hypothetical protein
MTGASRVAKAAPDGYQLVLGNVGTHAANQTFCKMPLFSPASVAFTVFHNLRALACKTRHIAAPVSNVIAGQIDMMMGSPSIGLAAPQVGRVKAYVVTAGNRLPPPDIPTVDEAGLPGFYALGWFRLWAPKGTPRDIISRLSSCGPKPAITAPSSVSPAGLMWYTQSAGVPGGTIASADAHPGRSRQCRTGPQWARFHKDPSPCTRSFV